MNKLLHWLSGFLPFREISDGNVPYLERYYIGTVCGWRFYLHQFVGSDPAGALHDHPWRMAFSIILSGWYWEETSYGVRRVRWFNWLVGDSKHRVVLPLSLDDKPPPCWTLFFHAVGDAKKWGMYTRIDGQPDALLFTPYIYTREGSQKDWWITAPKRANRQKS
jgi:hypothetical protein